MSDDAEVFATAELRSFEQVLGPSPVRSTPEGELRFGHVQAREVRPELFPPSFRALTDFGDWRYVRVVVPFELPAGPAEFADATVAILRPGPGAVVLDLEPPRRADGGGLIRALAATAIPVAYDPGDDGRALPAGIAVGTSGQGFNVMRWTLSAARGGPLPAGGFVVAGVVQLPRAATVFTGDLAPQAALVRPMLRLRRPIPTRTLDPFPFTVPILAPAAARPMSTVDGGDGTQRLCVAADIESYSRRTTAGHLDAQRRLVRALDLAAEHAGMSRDLWQNQPQGDGLLAVLPPTLNAPRYLPDLLHELRIALKETNRFVLPEARIRLRLGLQLGLVADAANGWAGAAVVEACRLRDCPPARDLLRDDLGTDLVVAASQRVYDDIIHDEPRHLRRADFKPAEVDLKGSGQSTAWLSATA
ncbi:hypothetical protein ACQP00_29925 [Dactylosporangium sp. CS-047395]|uniref:hypothetical protein n=1 Tax=Dactylosporangium sp. CS-047395 TaxID=3239936 RepID=UPI003D8E55F1